MEIVEFNDYISNLENYLNSNNFTVLVTSNKIYCLQGTYSKLNEDFCRNNSIEILKTRHFGGTIINFKEDICVGNFQKCNNTFGKDFMVNLIDFIKNKGLNCELVDNDLLVNGFKCASYMTTNINGCLYTAIHISIGMDLDLIKNICTKPMNKIPKGLSEFGVRTEDLLEFLLTELENYSDKTEES